MIKNSFLIIILLLLASNLYSQCGSNDYSFNPSDLGFGNGDGSSNTVYATAVQDDNKTVICASQFYNGTLINYIARINIDGSIDTSFVTGTGLNNRALAIAIQSDGKIIIGGFFTNYNGIECNKIIRLNIDGSVDSGFNIENGADNTIRAIAIQSDNKILIGGSFSEYDGVFCGKIARLNTDGSLDTTFNSGNGTGIVRTIAIQNDGKIIIGGAFTFYNETDINRIARLNIDGSLDNTFNPGSGFDDEVWSLAIQNDGKILAGGEFNFFDEVPVNYVIRLDSLGNIDAEFITGTGFNNQVRAITIQENSKILIGGVFTSFNDTILNGIGRLNSDGSIDTSFTSGNGPNDFVYNIAIQNDDKIIIGGDFYIYDDVTVNHITRLFNNGNHDNTFNPGTGSNYYIWATAIQEDGKILIGGDFTKYNGTTVKRLARLNFDGSLDTTFITGSGPDRIVHSFSIQEDEKIIIAGDFTNYNGTEINKIARLNPDGSLDNTFNPLLGSNSIIYTTNLQSGKIIAGGWIPDYDGTGINNIIRLNSDGSRDEMFNPGLGADDYVFSSAIQNDGKLLIGGDFKTYNGDTVGRIARLNFDGSLDETFDQGTGVNLYVWSISPQPDGKIVIGGLFTNYNGTNRGYIARINNNGSLDTTFNPGIGADDEVHTTAIQSDGKIIIAGSLTNYNGTDVNYIAQINQMEAWIQPLIMILVQIAISFQLQFKVMVILLLEETLQAMILLEGTVLPE